MDCTNCCILLLMQLLSLLVIPTGAQYRSLHSYVTTFMYSVALTYERSVLLLLSLLTVWFSFVGSELVRKLAQQPTEQHCRG